MRVRWFVGLWSVLVALVGVTVVVYDRVAGFNAPSDQVVEVPDPQGDGAPTTSAAGRPPEGPGSVRVEGVVTAVHLEGAVPAPRTVPAPLTLVSERGLGNGGELTGVEVGGRPSAVVWDGGRPFELVAGPGLVLDPVTVDLVPDGLRVALGGGVHALEPGPHRLETPVAVGQAGVATPYDALAFTAGPDAQLEAAGEVALLLGADGPRRFVGPGAVRLEGDLLATSPGGRAPAAVVELGSGPFDLTFRPAPGGGWRVRGLLQPGRGTELSLA